MEIKNISASTGGFSRGSPAEVVKNCIG